MPGCSVSKCLWNYSWAFAASIATLGCAALPIAGFVRWGTSPDASPSQAVNFSISLNFSLMFLMIYTTCSDLQFSVLKLTSICLDMHGYETETVNYSGILHLRK